MAKAPWAKLTKPIRPIVTDSPTDTINSTMPAARPPSSMLRTSMPKITSGPPSVGDGSRRRRSDEGAAASHLCRALVERPRSLAGRYLQRLAGIFDILDGRNRVLRKTAIPHDHLGQILIHHDVARLRVDQDRTAWT